MNVATLDKARSFTVTGNLGRFVIGQTLTSNADIVEYIKAGINEGRDAALVITDEDLLAAFDEAMEKHKSEPKDERAELVELELSEKFD